MNVYLLKMFLAFWLCFVDVNGVAKFQSLSCSILKPEWVDVNECRIKAINRTLNVININVTLTKTFKECQIHYKIVKRERGGWHPFLYSKSMELCDFLKHRNKYAIAKLIYSYFEPYTNIHQICPFEENTKVILSKFRLDEKSVISRFPIDFGEYGVQTTFYSENIAVAQLNGSIIYSQH